MEQQQEQKQPTPARIIMLPGLVIMCPGGSHFVEAIVTDQEGYLYQENVKLEFMSGNPIIANVYLSTSGILIQATEAGHTLITVKICGTSISTTIIVQVLENYILSILQNLIKPISVEDLVPMLC